LNAQVRRLEAAQTNVVNAVSFTQVQDGYMQTIDRAFGRMGELAMLARDKTKNPRDRALYDQEFQQIMEYVNDTRGKKFNAVPLFDGAQIPVTIDTEGETFDMPGVDMDASGYTNALNTEDAPTHEGGAYTSFTSGIDGLEYVNAIQIPATHDLQTGNLVKISGVNGLVEGQIYVVQKVNDWIFQLAYPENWDLEQEPPVMINDVPIEIDGATRVQAYGGNPASGNFDTGVVVEDWTNRVHIQSGLEADKATAQVTAAIARLAQDRSALGAVQSRLNFTNDQLTTTKENLTSAISRIVDVDVAEEATKYARSQILVQSGAQMLVKANELPNIALRLLGG
jgi:flagellin